MTNKEALEHIRSHRHFDTANAQDREAIGAAIAEMEKQFDIVHCKDCHAWTKNYAGLGDHVGVCILAGWMIGENGFCLYGDCMFEHEGSCIWGLDANCHMSTAWEPEEEEEEE